MRNANRKGGKCAREAKEHQERGRSQEENVSVRGLLTMANAADRLKDEN